MPKIVFMWTWVLYLSKVYPLSANTQHPLHSAIAFVRSQPALGSKQPRASHHMPSEHLNNKSNHLKSPLINEKVCSQTVFVIGFFITSDTSTCVRYQSGEGPELSCQMWTPHTGPRLSAALWGSKDTEIIARGNEIMKNYTDLSPFFLHIEHKHKEKKLVSKSLRILPKYENVFRVPPEQSASWDM